VAVRSLQERKVRADALEPHNAVHSAALDRSIAFHLESELDEELSRGREVVNHDADVVHPLDRQLPDGRDAGLASETDASPRVR
jgi:hypothetical protein